MPRSSSHRHLTATAVLFAVALTSLALAACGSSSNTSSTNTSASTAKAGTPGSNAAVLARVGAHFAVIRACLSKHGITLPQRPKPGQRPSPGTRPAIPGLHLPKGMTQAQYQAILKKCSLRIGPGGLASGRGLLGSAAARQALTKFASCMRENGVHIPAPNTSGSGPIFSSKGLNTRSRRFQAAEAKCRVYLRSTLRASPGARTAPPGSPHSTR
jgi:hypothetical protein